VKSFLCLTDSLCHNSSTVSITHIWR